MLQAKNSHMPLQFPSRVFYSLCWSGRWGSVDRGIKELRHTDSVMFDDRERHEKYWPLQRVKSRPSDNEDAFSHDWCRINSKSCVLFRSIHSQHITQHEVAFEFAHRDISAGFAGLAFIIFHVGTILSIKWISFVVRGGGGRRFSCTYLPYSSSYRTVQKLFENSFRRFRSRSHALTHSPADWLLRMPRKRTLLRLPKRRRT